MLAVIGTSFTVEYALKGAYENTVGRLTEPANDEMTEEDRYAAGVAQHYGLFVQDRPFYEFPFFVALRGLWAESRLWGPHAIRKWERKLWLSFDYGAEGAYCGLITLASHAVYGVEEDITFAVIDHASEAIFSSVPAITKVKSLGNDSFLVRMPRYQKFTDAAKRLFQERVQFVEIAGNRQIMVTAIVSRDWTFGLPAGELLFSQDRLIDASKKRVTLRVPVANLGTIAGQLALEHIYDY